MSDTRKLTTQKFIEKSQKIHGDKYDYSSSVYVNARTNVEIICPEHGLFKQNAMSHMLGQGCQKCAHVYSGTTSEFIDRAKNIYGDKYDYSLVDYINSYTKVKIICPDHGLFEITPHAHLHNRTCRKCTKRFNFNIEDFISKAKLVHGDKYDYSLVDYKGAGFKIKIICPEHGPFEQFANNHTSKKQGCPICASLLQESKGEKIINDFLIERKININRQHIFNECKNINPLPFDFYLYDYNTCIEYDGEQHFKPIEFFGGEEGLKYRQNNDTIKTKYCNDNNIVLLRISYIENIIDKLNNFIIKSLEV